ncbi:hypothetical protein LCGC14_1381200 [marine sediment metagenome]|uniref:Sulfotransferase domain-containing protein n=1 Tax=marine sediment metagenome TaxID=412755 RepID=A0A0F9K2Q3_9ZZZZ
MSIINRRYNWLFLAEGYTGSRAYAEALLKLESSEEVGRHHARWPELRDKGLIDTLNLDVFSVVRHPLDIIATQCAKNDKNSVPYWLTHRFLSRQSFFMHRPDITIKYENGLKSEIELVVGATIDVRTKFKTEDKIKWQNIFTKEDVKFALATIPELITLGYVPSALRHQARSYDVNPYLEEHKNHA